MIQINLLRESSSRRRLWVPKKTRVDLYVAIIAAVAIVGVLAWHWELKSTRDAAQIRQAELQQQSLELAAVRAELQRYQAQKQRLEDRAEIIEELRDSQKGPVQMLNGVIAAMPTEPRLWLTSLNQQDKTVTIEGNAFDVPAIADFIANLTKYQPFDSVELSFWEDRKDSVAFGLNCTIKSQ
jgi:Tfp pilus assembly protein PilN